MQRQNTYLKHIYANFSKKSKIKEYKNKNHQIINTIINGYKKIMI